LGRHLYDQIQVPVGLISSNWGGTIVQAWTSSEGLEKCNQTNYGTSPEQINPNQDSVLYNAMIAPFISMQIMGAIWYQGESNVGEAQYYQCAFPAMINDWRNQLNLPNLFFLFVQLAPYTEGLGDLYSLPELRLAQEAALSLNNVGMATTIDLGDPLSPFGNIHPRDKDTVGLRLSLVASALAYKYQVFFLGPTFSNATLTQESPITISIMFDPDSIADGLEFHNVECPSPVPANYCAAFEIGLKTDSGIEWVAVDQVDILNGQTVQLSLSSEGTVAGVRYIFANWPLAVLFNTENLPAPPFYYLIS